MSNLRRSIIADNLRAVAEMLSIFPFRTVQDALDRLEASSAGIPADLLDLSGSVACEAIEGELLALSWKAVA